jgi:hypothetical protein
MQRPVPGIWPLLGVVAVGVVATLAVDLDIVKTLITSAGLRTGIKAFTLLLSAGSGVYSYVRSERRHSESSQRQERREAMALLEATLASSIQNLFVGELPQTIRSNLMVVSGHELQMLAGSNMLVFPDFKVRLRIGQGCAGAAWEQAEGSSISDFWRPVVATSTDLTTRRQRDTWHLTEEQVRLTAHILWIVSIPLFTRLHGQLTFLGVLNFDGVHQQLRHADRLSQPDFLGQCASVGERVAEVVSNLGAPLLEQIDLGERNR